MRNTTMRLLAALALTLPSLAVAAPGSAAPGSVATTYAAISGSGSTYETVPIDLWSQDVRTLPLVVNYNPDGSEAGLIGFINDQEDFAASDVAFSNGRDKLAGLPYQTVPWGFSYLPAVAIGIAFVYHLSAHGQPVRNLRLSGPTLMGIFTGQITNWDNPRITRDYGSQLPSLPITPVFHTEIAGTTFFFTRWLAHEFPRQWNAFCDRVHPGITPPCGPTVLYPPFGQAKGEDGSYNVTSYIASAAGNGAIGYDETPYAISSHLPELALRNPAGRYVRPSPANVTTALTAALINQNPHSAYFLRENLNPVYVSKNPASYLLSAYSYLIVPRAGRRVPPIFNKAKGLSLSTFLVYAYCHAQSQLPSLNVPSLPANLVSGGLLQVRQIPGHGQVPARCG